MKKNSVFTIMAFVVVILCNCNKNSQTSPASLADPLPSWNNGELKKAILAYVQQVTDSASSDYIPVADRIATFDNDGTLWAERPYMQELFAFYRVKEMGHKNPELAKKQPFKAVMEHDKSYFEKGGDKAAIELIVATHTGMSETDFESSVHNFFKEVKYPGLNVSAKQITYQPQIELLSYLRANGFKTFICTGGTVDFVRGISDAYYGIPKEQVIGSSFQYQFIDSNRSIMRKPELNSFCDKVNKPVNIQWHIGRAPVFACGNEGGGGDIAMLKFSQTSHYPTFQMIINHDDSVREYYYQEKDNASLNAAAENKWHVASIKNDWKQVFVK